MKYFKNGLLGMSVTAIVAIHTASALAETGQEGHGGFKSRAATKMIEESAKQLTTIVTDSGLPMFVEYPVRRESVLYALHHIEVKPLVSRVRSGDMLVLDYDRNKQTLTVLKDFFDIYTPASKPAEAIPQIRILLLHEAAHLWGANDDEAENFANAVMSAGVIDPGFSHQRDHVCQDMSLLSSPLDSVNVQQCFNKVHHKYCDESSPEWAQELKESNLGGSYLSPFVLGNKLMSPFTFELSPDETKKYTLMEYQHLLNELTVDLQECSEWGKDGMTHATRGRIPLLLQLSNESETAK